MTDLCRAGNSDGTLSEHREWIRLCLHFRRLIATRGTGTTPTEIAIGIGGLVTVVPGDGNSTRCGEPYRGWDRLHEGGHASMETVVGGAKLAILIWAATALAMSRNALA